MQSTEFKLRWHKLSIRPARGASQLKATTFLSNETLWQAISAQLNLARRVDAAIAYLGQGGAKILPLKRGDRLVADMSPANVRAGSTDPREIERLVQRSVQAFTRHNLRVKLNISHKSVISGSANVSKHS